MYKKTDWKARKGANLNRFEKLQETERFVILENKPNSVTVPGTPFNETNMNKIEQGISDAHEMIAREEQSRMDGDKEVLVTAKAYTDEAQLATQTWLPAVNTVANLPVTEMNKNINYLCRTINDPDQSKNGVYQCIAGWDNEPVWTFFSDDADWIDENEMAVSINAAINEHNTKPEVHKNIQDSIEDEVSGRKQAITEETLARNYAVNAEAQTRAAADNKLQGNIDNTNNNLQGLQDNFNAWIGRGGYLNAFDFGTFLPTQEELTNQALSQISSIANPLQIWNGTKIVNLFNNYLWVLTNTPDTDPPVFEWSNQGTSDVTPFVPDRGGYIVGANHSDPPEYVRPLLNGKGRIDIDAIVDAIFDKEHPVGDVVVQYPGTDSPKDKDWRGQWVDWTSRASAYRLRTSSFGNVSTYTKNANYTKDTIVMYHLNGDDWGYYKAKEAITGAAEQLDPVKWEQQRTGTLIWRNKLQDINPWADADLSIGQSITRNGTTYYVEEIIVYGGKYFAGYGGNRPAFESGGVDRDVSRQIKASTAGSPNFNGIRGTPSGAFYSVGSTKSCVGEDLWNAIVLGFDSSRVVPTGAENSPRTLSVIYWLRIG